MDESTVILNEYTEQYIWGWRGGGKPFHGGRGLPLPTTAPPLIFSQLPTTTFSTKIQSCFLALCEWNHLN